AEGGRAASVGGDLDELLFGHVGADVVGLVGSDDAVGVGVHTVPEQGPHLRLGHRLPGQAEECRAGADPPARWVAFGGVVLGGVLAARSGDVAAGDVAGEV